MRNVSRNRFLGCFKPVADMDLMLESEAVAADRVQSEEDMMKPSDMENSTVIPHPAKKTFSQVIKVAVFRINLAKSVGGRKVIDHSAKHNFRLNRDFVGREKQEIVPNPNSVSSASSCSSSSSSFQKSKGQELKNNQICSCNNQESTKTKPRQQRRDRSSSSSWSSDCVIFFVLVTLAVMIFWGKFFAILFTSIWLYFLPPYQKPSSTVIGKLESVDRSREKKSGNCRKKVIMEGLLERNPQRRGMKALT